MRQMSEEEEAFIAQALETRESVATDDSKTRGKKKKVKRKKRFYQKISTWAAVVMMIPIALSAFFMLNMIRIQNIIGNDAVKVLTSEQLPEDFKEQAAAGGMEWIPQYIELYKNKELIVGGLLTAGIVVVMIMFLIEAVVKHYRIRKENAEAITEET